MIRPAIRLLVLCSATALVACSDDEPSSTRPTDPSPRVDAPYEATIVRTDKGIPHITSRTYGGLGYGQAYAFAEDNLCVMMDDFITIRGERARYFGPEGSYTIPANDAVADNVSSDFFWKFIADAKAVQRTRDRTEAEFQTLVRGWVAGFNRYLAEVKAGRHPGRHAACASGDWLQPITTDDMYRRFVRLSVLASSSVFVSEIANAQPPGASGLPQPGGGTALPGPLQEALAPVLNLLAPVQGLLGQRSEATAWPLRGGTDLLAPERLAAVAAAGSLPVKRQALASQPGPFAGLRQPDRFGSNMYAIGKSGSASGQPIVFGNPHFPWQGTERLYISHNTIPGELDIMGASLYGVPAVLIGFNRHVAWSHTVSTAYRFTLYELKMNPLNPRQYLYDGQLRDLEAVPLSIEVRQPDGSLLTQNRTLYRSHYGPMITLSAAGVPVLPWSPVLAYTLRDANLENDRLINQFGRWNQARSLDEFMALHKSVLGVPWVNTVASGPNGRAYYGDVTVVPNVPDSLVSTCGNSPLAAVIGQVAPGLPLLDGSRSACEWKTDADAPAPGIFGPGNLPTLVRDDYVTNCNDSYWLTNPSQPLTGFARIIGDENAARSLRTRLCILQAERRLDGSDRRDGNRFTVSNLRDIVLSGEIHTAELARQAVLDDLCTQPGLVGSSGQVAEADQAAACAALSAWDGRADLASTGAHLWREFWRRLSAPALGLPVGLPVPTPLTDIWRTPFSAASPVTTPNTLNTTALTVQQAFADSIAAVKAAGVEFAAPLGTLQKSGVHNGRDIAVFGGEGFEGAFTIASSGDQALTRDGYRIVFGNSYIQTVTWAADGTPQAGGFITYSQSTDPASPHYADFTEAYRDRQWQTFPFTPDEVAARKRSTLTLRQSAAQ